MVKNHCIDCGTKISKLATRCWSCAKKAWWANSEHRFQASIRTKKQWEQNPERRIITSKRMKAVWKNPDLRTLVSQKAKLRYQDPIWHEITGEALRKKWQDQEFRAKHSRYKNPFYINGKYIDLYGPGFTLSLKKEIRIRDHFKCQNCGYQEDGRALHIHHIDYSKENHELNNLISLCKPCHDKTLARKERLKWKLYYQNIMKNKKQLFDHPMVKEILDTQCQKESR